MLLRFIPRDAIEIERNFQDVRGGLGWGELNWSVEACSQMVSRIMVYAWSDVTRRCYERRRQRQKIIGEPEQIVTLLRQAISTDSANPNDVVRSPRGCRPVRVPGWAW
jgi:hypothetical protein